MNPCTWVHTYACVCVCVCVCEFEEFLCLYPAYSVGPFNPTFILSLIPNFSWVFPLLSWDNDRNDSQLQIHYSCRFCKHRAEFSKDFLFASLQMLSLIPRHPQAHCRKDGFSLPGSEGSYVRLLQCVGVSFGTGKPARPPGSFLWQLLPASSCTAL